MIFEIYLFDRKIMELLKDPGNTRALKDYRYHHINLLKASFCSKKE
jgi:hypothetical protein